MMTSRRGFTLIELLVVITIIGIFTGMLMPALHTAREAGRRTACANNLLRLGLATGAYESAHGFYPAGVTDSKGPLLSQANGLHHAWTERLLPYLDERTAFTKIDFAASVYDTKNAAVRRLQLTEFLCPSDEIVEEGPHSSYAACHNEAEAPIDADNHGVFFLNSHLRPDDVTDGLAYTLFIAEKKSDGAGNDLGWTSGTRATLRNTGTPLNGTGPRATVSKPATGGPKFVGGFGSDHLGGIVVMMFGDGSVRYVGDVVSPQVLKLLGNRADGQLINLKDLER
jgi:prepilin-type N-terminal cleavage/methylation domain-containing protein